MGPTDNDFNLAERNRELIAARLKWPLGSVEVCRALERQHPGHAVWWGTGWSGDPQPGYYAIRSDGTQRGRPAFYGPSAVELGVTLETDEAARRRSRW